MLSEKNSKIRKRLNAAPEKSYGCDGGGRKTAQARALPCRRQFGRHRAADKPQSSKGGRYPRDKHPPTPQGPRGPLTEQEAERGPAGREGQQQVRQAGPRAAHEAAVVGGALAAAQLLQPPPLRRVARAVRQGPQQHLWPETGAAR